MSIAILLALGQSLSGSLRCFAQSYPYSLESSEMAMSEGNQVLLYAMIICGGVFILGMWYKKCIAPVVARRFPPSAPLHGQGDHGSSHGHGGSHSSANGVAHGSTKVHEDYVRQMEMGTVRA